jgi:hypothetical protein
MPGRCGGLPEGSAGLPRRFAPRNDNGGDGNGRGGTRYGFRMPDPVLSLRGRSRRELSWQSSLRRDAGCRAMRGVAGAMRWDAQTVPGLPRRCTPRNDKKGDGLQSYQSSLKSAQFGFSRSINSSFCFLVPAFNCFSRRIALLTFSKVSKYTKRFNPYLLEKPSFTPFLCSSIRSHNRPDTPT